MTFSIPAPRHLNGLETCTWMCTEMVSFGPFSFNTHGTLTLQHQVVIITRSDAIIDCYYTATLLWWLQHGHI